MSKTSICDKSCGINCSYQHEGKHLILNFHSAFDKVSLAFSKVSFFFSQVFLKKYLEFGFSLERRGGGGLSQVWCEIFKQSLTAVRHLFRRSMFCGCAKSKDIVSYRLSNRRRFFVATIGLSIEVYSLGS